MQHKTRPSFDTTTPMTAEEAREFSKRAWGPSCVQIAKRLAHEAPTAVTSYDLNGSLSMDVERANISIGEMRKAGLVTTAHDRVTRGNTPYTLTERGASFAKLCQELNL